MPDPSAPAPPPSPALGLVCISHCKTLKYRTITRTRFLALSPEDRLSSLASIYGDNLQTLYNALAFCLQHQIRLYRVTSNLLPMNDDPVGQQVLASLAPKMAPFGPRAQRLGIRVLIHPDQYVVLSSDSDQVVRQSIGIMQHHARVFDDLHLDRSAWNCMILHGGKAGRSDRLVRVIADLPDNIRSRLVLENDESAYGAEEILAVCRRARVPMVFDAHHHTVHEKLSSYDDPSVAHYTAAARDTWPDPSWQIVHLSNGIDSITDARHTDYITAVPAAYRAVPWIEVEAKAKEAAIQALRQQWPEAS